MSQIIIRMFSACEIFSLSWWKLGGVMILIQGAQTHSFIMWRIATFFLFTKLGVGMATWRKFDSPVLTQIKALLPLSLSLSNIKG